MSTCHDISTDAGVRGNDDGLLFPALLALLVRAWVLMSLFVSCCLYWLVDVLIGSLPTSPSIHARATLAYTIAY